MEGNTGKLLVIIVTYNAMQWAKRCFDSIVNSSVLSDVFVVDNGSTDGTQEFIQKEYPNVLFHQSENNLGFGKANNVGIRYAIQNGYSYVYLLNQDAWVDSDTFKTLIEFSGRYPDYGIISPMQTTSDKSVLDKAFAYTRVSMDDFYHNRGICECSFVMAAHWLLPVSVIKRVGLFSEAFIHYGEDVNLCDRMQYYGYKVGICTTTFSVHDRGSRIPLNPDQGVIRYSVKYNTLANRPLHNSLLKSFANLIIYSFTILKDYRNASCKTKFRTIFKMIGYFNRSNKYRALYTIEGYGTK